MNMPPYTFEHLEKRYNEACVFLRHASNNEKEKALMLVEYWQRHILASLNMR